MKQNQWSRSDFIFHKQLGVGKYGVVYQANQKQTGHIVAIKIVPKKKITSQILHKRLQRQVEIHTRLQHNNISRMYGYFEDQYNLYMVMEYYPHGNLFAPVKIEKQKFSQKKIASIIHQLASAIGYLAKRNIIHRDIKLENILFDANYNIKLTDFGCCVHTLKKRNTFCGTVQYLCPQMLDQQEYGHQIDFYCLGIVLYELFYFKSPFFDDSEEKIIMKIKEGKIDFDQSVRVISEDAQNLIKTLLLKSEQKISYQQVIGHPFIHNNLHNKGQCLRKKQQKLD